MTTTVATKPAGQQITDEVTSWPGVTAGTGRRGEFGFRVGRREIGHLHGDRSAHFSFPKEIWRDLFAQGRVVHHPVFPGKEGPAACRIENEDDVRDVIALLRLNYDRVIERYGAPAGTFEPVVSIPGLYASAPAPLPFAPSLHTRAFLLARDRGNVLVYSVPGLESAAAAIEELGGVSRHYLNHGHEAMFASDGIGAPVFVHADDRETVAGQVHVRGTFSKRHTLDDDLEIIPTPGHTAGATALLWDSGEHRLLFTGDTIYLDQGEWVEALLESSDRSAYIESLELIRELDFDVLVPWAASAGGPFHQVTGKADARRRIDLILARLRSA
jgi:hypothetical protein